MERKEKIKGVGSAQIREGGDFRGIECLLKVLGRKCLTPIIVNIPNIQRAP